MEAGITPGLTVNTHAHLLSASAPGQNRWQLGHAQAQRDSFASARKITDSSVTQTLETTRRRDGRFRSSAGHIEPCAVMDGVWGWDLSRRHCASQACSAACVDDLTEVPLHVKRIIWHGFIPFNWESRNRIRQSGKKWAKPLSGCWQPPCPCQSKCSDPLVWKGSELQPDFWLEGYFLGLTIRTSLLQAPFGIIIQISAFFYK